MATTGYLRQRIFVLEQRSLRRSSTRTLYLPNYASRSHRSRPFSSSTRGGEQNKSYKEPFGTRLRKALADTKIKWYPIPVALGIAFLGLSHLYRVNEREKTKRFDDENEDGEERVGRPKRRERIRPTGPW